MGSVTRRSKAERALQRDDQVLERNRNVTKLMTLDPPDRIRDHPQKLDTWNYLTTDLAHRQLLSSSYIVPLIILCDNIVSYNELLEMYEGSGPLIPMLSQDGNTVKGYKENPLFSMLKRTEKIINTMCEKFGLNPKDAVYTANPDVQQKIIEAQQDRGPVQNKITYFA